MPATSWRYGGTMRWATEPSGRRTLVWVSSPECSSSPIRMGTVGPYTSASIRPTRAPVSARATARFAATVDLPTPPLPEPTAITCLTPGRSGPLAPLRAVTLAVMSMLMLVTPGIWRTASRQSASILALSGQAGVVSSTVKATLPSQILTFLIMPRDTRSRCRSGSWTVPRAPSTCASDTGASGGAGSVCMVFPGLAGAAAWRRRGPAKWYRRSGALSTQGGAPGAISGGSRIISFFRFCRRADGYNT